MLKRGFQFAPGYRLQEFLGRGQFGQVWRATAPGGAAAAVKFIDLSDGQGQKEYEAIKRVKQIRHANLMPITAIWLLDGQGQVIEEAPDEAVETIDLSVPEPRGQSAVYRPEIEPSWLVVAMLLGGKSLQQRLRECVREGLPGIPPKELISYMDESAKGIDFLNSPRHDLGEGPIAIQHSDIKPANIVLIGSSAVVCDFGLARILTRNQVTATSAAGTPAYMAPEAISGKPSRTSDQYSLAVTYYHLRTGTLPVTDGSLWEVLDAHRQGNLKLGLVSEAEREVLRRATDLNWENRFESNVEMVDALREALRAEGQTKPSFVPKGAALAPPPAAGQPSGNEGDPTATIDLPATEGATNQSLKETAPLLTTEKSTHPEGGFLNETLPELDESPAARTSEETHLQTHTVVEEIRLSRRLMAGIGAGLVVVIVTAFAASRPSSDDGSPDTLQDRQTAEVVTDPDPDDVTAQHNPSALLVEATELLETDEQQAVAKFDAALQIEPRLALLTPRELAGHQGSILWMRQTPDGSNLVTLADGAVPRIWRLESGTSDCFPLHGHDGTVYAMAIDPSGRRLLTGGTDRNARLWNLDAADVAAGSLELKGHQGTVEAAAWHPGGDVVATASQDTNLGIWKLGLATSQSPNGTIADSTRIPINEQLRALASDSAGIWLAARTVGNDPIEEQVDVLVYPWDELIDEHENSPPPRRLGASSAKYLAVIGGAENPMVVTGDVGGTISVYSITKQMVIDRKTDVHVADVDAMQTVRADHSDVIVTGSADGSVHWWKYGSTTVSRKRQFSPTQSIGCVDVSSDGRWVAAGTTDGSVWLWDTDNGEPDRGVVQILTAAASVDSIKIDFGSRWLIAGCDDGMLRVWDLKMAKLLALTRPTLAEESIEKEIKVPPLAMR